jgi:hypothetical protein
VDGAALRGDDRAGLIHRLPCHVHDAAERLVADRHRDRRAGVADRLAANEALADVHGDGADGIFAEVLRNLQHQPVAVVVRFQRIQDGRKMTLELHVHHGADHLGDHAGRLLHSV